MGCQPTLTYALETKSLEAFTSSSAGISSLRHNAEVFILGENPKRNDAKPEFITNKVDCQQLCEIDAPIYMQFLYWLCCFG